VQEIEIRAESFSKKQSKRKKIIGDLGGSPHLTPEEGSTLSVAGSGLTLIVW
jgi:hypothetical protein